MKAVKFNWTSRICLCNAKVWNAKLRIWRFALGNRNLSHFPQNNLFVTSKFIYLRIRISHQGCRDKNPSRCEGQSCKKSHAPASIFRDYHWLHFPPPMPCWFPLEYRCVNAALLSIVSYSLSHFGRGSLSPISFAQNLLIRGRINKMFVDSVNLARWKLFRDRHHGRRETQIRKPS